jgi:hypothetical protein
VPERRSVSTVRATAADAIAFLTKAHEYLDAANDSMARGNRVAAVGNAIHATIAAADAVASLRLKSRWRGDHPGAADHVAAAGAEGQICAKSLRRVIPLKHQAEYDPAPIPASKAQGALRAASQAVEAAEIAIAEGRQA